MKLNRRGFLKRALAAGSMAVGGGSILSACSSIRRSDMPDQDFMKPSFRKQSVDHTAKLARQGGGWLIITSEGQTVADLIETGRRFEQMALLARERSIAIQPMTQYLEEKEGLKQIAANHEADVVSQFVLRVGYLKTYPEPVSLRRPVNWFVRS